MFAIGGVLIYLAIAKEYEPTLLLPIGLGAILANIPYSAAIGVDGEPGILRTLFDFGIRTELFPLLIFVGIGAMIDFGPLLQNPKMLLFGAAAQFGIFFTMCLAAALHFTLKESASIGSGGRADVDRRGQSLCAASVGANHGGGVFVHVAGADHPAAGNPAAHF
jgi:Na+-transporting methylmalonyl-CoA/oxaloacetate decarboxylase beta subunit